MTNESLVDIIDHLLNRGTVLLGRSTISVADVDLVDLEIQLVLSSIESLGRKAGSVGRLTTAVDHQPGAPAQQPAELVEIYREEEPHSAPQPGSGEPSDRRPRDVPGIDEQHEIPVKGERQVPKNLTENRPPKLALPLLDGGGEPPERGLARLALTIVEILRQIVERQAVRRMDGGALAEHDVERMGVALMELEEKMAEIRDMFGLEQNDLELDLGPLDRLLA